MKIRIFIKALATLSIGSFALSGFAQEAYPNKLITLVVPSSS